MHRRAGTTARRILGVGDRVGHSHCLGRTAKTADMLGTERRDWDRGSRKTEVGRDVSESRRKRWGDYKPQRWMLGQLRLALAQVQENLERTRERSLAQTSEPRFDEIAPQVEHHVLVLSRCRRSPY